MLLVRYEPLKSDHELKALAVYQVTKQSVQISVIGSLVKSQILAVLVKQIKFIRHVLSDELFGLCLEFFLYDHVIPF
jgi:hypothetical protein